MPPDIIQVTIAEMKLGYATRGDGWLVIRFSERFFDSSAELQAIRWRQLLCLRLRGAASREMNRQ